MPDSRAEFERELKLSDAEKATGALRRIVADFDEIDRELQAAEKRAGLEVAPTSLSSIGWRGLDTVNVPALQLVK